MSVFEKMVLTNQKCQNFDQGTILRAIQPNPPYDMLFMSSQRSFMQKKKKSYGTVFEKIHFKPKMSKFWPRNNPSSDSTKSSLWYVVYVIPKKLHAKKRKKVMEQFLRKFTLNFFPFDPILILDLQKSVTVIESHHISF